MGLHESAVVGGTIFALEGCCFIYVAAADGSSYAARFNDDQQGERLEPHTAPAWKG